MMERKERLCGVAVEDLYSESWAKAITIKQSSIAPNMRKEDTSGMILVGLPAI